MAISDADKLAIYNGALRRLGSRRLASLAENREPRRVLDDIWGAGDKIARDVLELGDWNFAIKSVEGVYSPSVEPPFGHTRAFNKPDDFRRLSALSADPYFRLSLTASEYSDEAGYWFTDHDVIYIRYVSDDTDYGRDSSKWTGAFTDYLEAKMAWEACERITNSTSKRDRLERDMAMALKTAKSHDAMNEGVKFPQPTSWQTARQGYGWGRRG